MSARIVATINGRDMTAEQYQRYQATRAAAWRRANPGQAHAEDEARADAAAARASGESASDVRAWLRSELADIDRQYADSESAGWYDDTPHVRGVWEL